MAYDPRQYIPDYSFIGRSLEQAGKAAMGFAQAKQKIDLRGVNEEKVNTAYKAGLEEAKRQAELYKIPWEEVRKKYSTTFLKGKDPQKTLEEWVAKKPNWENWIKQRLGEETYNMVKKQAEGYTEELPEGVQGPPQTVEPAKTRDELFGRVSRQSVDPTQQEIATKAAKGFGLPEQKAIDSAEMVKRRLALADKKSEAKDILEIEKMRLKKEKEDFYQLKNFDAMVDKNLSLIVQLQGLANNDDTPADKRELYHKTIKELMEENEALRTGNIDYLNELYKVRKGIAPTPGQQTDTGPSSTQPAPSPGINPPYQRGTARIPAINYSIRDSVQQRGQPFIPAPGRASSGNQKRGGGF